MAGTGTVCSMCGDVGFPDKLFQCARCRYRFQHSYCTNYYGDAAAAAAGGSDMCDWCLSDVAAGKQARYSSMVAGGGKMQQGAGSQESSSTTTSSSSAGRGGKGAGGEQESGRRGSKAAGRRYKLLKDVLC
uniref:PHD-type zinc finger plants domain-containing protein n=1 Tax=Leersia perrieri TaxID=77586 RepID=A0A0D9W7Y1_9ORYZ